MSSSADGRDQYKSIDFERSSYSGRFFGAEVRESEFALADQDIILLIELFLSFLVSEKSSIKFIKVSFPGTRMCKLDPWICSSLY